jgi:hypothetical protein
MPNPHTLNRYAAKLLFQYRVRVGAKDNRVRTCEERILVLNAATARAALAAAKRRGRASHLAYDNDDGNRVHFEFVGVMDLLKLGPECDDDEVWYDITRRTLPMERRDTLVPAEAELNAIRHQSNTSTRTKGVRRCD